MSVIICNSSVTPEYFNNSMNEDELNAVLQEIENKIKNEKEELRFKAWITAVSAGAKKQNGDSLELQDIMRFEWDTVCNYVEISPEEHQQIVTDFEKWRAEQQD